MKKNRIKEIVVKKSFLISLLFGLFFIGCATPYAEAPVATNFANSEQSKLQAGSHWGIIAKHLAKSITENVGKEKVVYLNEPQEKSKFNTALHTLVLSAMVENGMSVAKIPTAANITVDLKTQVIKFSPDRATFRNSFGAPTLLAAGVWTMIGVGAANTTANSIGAGATAAAVGLDAYNWFGSKYDEIPQHEIIVTATASNANKYISSVSNVYYIADSDKSLYYTVPKGEKITIVGEK